MLYDSLASEEGDCGVDGVAFDVANFTRERQEFLKPSEFLVLKDKKYLLLQLMQLSSSLLSLATEQPNSMP